MPDIRRIVKLYPPESLVPPGDFENNAITGFTAVEGTATSKVHSVVTSSTLPTTGSSSEALGSYVLHHTATAAVSQYVGQATNLIPCKPGDSFYAEDTGLIGSAGTADGQSLSVVIEFFTSATAYISGVSSDLFSDRDTWSTLSVTATAPATAAYWRAFLVDNATASGAGTLNSYWNNVRVRQVLLDLNDDTTYSAVRDTFQIQQGARGSSLAASGTRYGGGDIASEALENDKVAWQALVAGSTVDSVLANCEAIVAVTERSNFDTFIEWRHEEATESTYFPIRGPAEFNLTHSSVRLTSGKAEYVDLAFPVAPLAQGDVSSQAVGTTTVPAVVSLSSIGGTAPAEMDILWRNSGEAVPFCLYGWSKTPGTPLSSSVAPFGIIDAETATDLSTWAAIGTDTDYRGSNGIRTTVSAAGSASATYSVDPSTMQPDDFTKNTIDIEVWARVELDEDVLAPRMTLSLEPHAGTAFGAVRYTPEYGSVGKLLVNKPTNAGDVLFRPVRLGTLTMPVDTANPLKWKVRVAASWTGGAGVFGLDYLVMVPARRRACTPTGVSKGSSYPAFANTTSDITKLIRSDLSGMAASAAGALGPDVGMGGATIEPSPGATSVVIWPSTEVPDDPTANGDEMLRDLSIAGATFFITPRYYLVR